MIIKDAMVVIHLAKITLLEKSCEHFRDVAVSEMVYREILAGSGVHPEVRIIEDLMAGNKIKVKKVKNRKLLERAKEFNIQRGEAESVALCWQEKADYLATDDDNVRKKSLILDVKVIGTPAIILKLYRGKNIKREKFEESLNELRKIGWFSNAVIDKLIMEG